MKDLSLKTFIQNRSHKKLCVMVKGPTQPKKLVFIMHGLGGSKDEQPIPSVAEAFADRGFLVVSFDTTNSFGESEGDYADATVTNYYADLEDVIHWAAQQPWYVEPFILCGHSLGGICTTLFAENYPDKVKALVPIATVVSGKLSLEAHALFPEKDHLEKWQQRGVRISKRHDGSQAKLKWSHMEDRLQYDLLTKAHRLTMSVLIIVGENDNRTPPTHQKILFDHLPGKKELHIIAGAHHTFNRPHERQELKQFIANWLDQL
jgi:pimeloyl-ACP methyl ester carboxylesterase